MIISFNDFKKHKRIVLKQNIIRIAVIPLFFIALVCVVIGVYNLDIDLGGKQINQETIKTYSSGPDCGNLSFQETAICLNDYVRKIFVYNVTDDNIDLTLDELISRGGDCRDWTNFYEEYMNYYGYDQTEKVRVFVDKEDDAYIYHVFLIASHSSGYCHMDMQTLECYQYANDKGEVRQ